jgi:hypothetical protein
VRVNTFADEIDMIEAEISAATASVAYAMPALQAGNSSWNAFGTTVFRSPTEVPGTNPTGNTFRAIAKKPSMAISPSGIT